MKSLERKRLGKLGETLAADYLTKRGFHILARNFYIRYGEIDIIALNDDTLIFIEVKTRIDETFGLPEEAVTQRKLKEIIKTAEYYKMTHRNLPDLMRIDVVAIELHSDDSLKAIRHIENVSQ